MYYYYDFKKVDGGAYGLQVPLQSREDPEIDLHYKKFKNLRRIGASTIFVPLVYFFSTVSTNTSGRRSYDSQTFWILYFGSIAANIGFEIGAKHHLNKAIEKYNTTIMKRNMIGLRLEPVQNYAAVGISLTHTF